MHEASDPLISFGEFAELTNDFKLEPWQKFLCDRLTRLSFEKKQRLIVHAPPQTGKSLLVSGRFPAWLLGRNPIERIALVSHDYRDAARYRDTVKAVMEEPEYGAVFPDEASSISSYSHPTSWSTHARMRSALTRSSSSFVPVGFLNYLCGETVDTLIIDNHYRSRKHAFSDALNEAMWDSWRHNLKARLSADANVIVIHHRWKIGDFMGRLMQEGGWEHIRFPALADEGGEGDWMPRFIGDSLSPRYPREHYEEIKSSDPFAFAALYQGRPINPGPISGRAKEVR